MRSVIPHPCIGSSCSAFSTSMSSVPWSTSTLVFAHIPFDRRKKRVEGCQMGHGGFAALWEAAPLRSPATRRFAARGAAAVRPRLQGLEERA